MIKVVLENMRKTKVGFGKIVTVLSPDFGNQPIKICLKYDQDFQKCGIHYISVLSALAQSIYKRTEGEILEYTSQTEKSYIEILKID